TGFTLDAGLQNELLGMGEVIGHLPADNQVWYQEESVLGDNTVPAESAIGPFGALDAASDRLTLTPIRAADAGGKAVGHSELLSNVYSQTQIVNQVATLGDAQVSHSLTLNPAQSLSASIGLGLLDPKEVVLDALDDVSRLLDGLTDSAAMNT